MHGIPYTPNASHLELYTYVKLSQTRCCALKAMHKVLCVVKFGEVQIARGSHMHGHRTDVQAKQQSNDAERDLR